MIEDLFELERLAYGTSPIHRLDARVKLLVTFGAIIAPRRIPRPFFHLPRLLIFALLLGLLPWRYPGFRPLFHQEGPL